MFARATIAFAFPLCNTSALNHLLNVAGMRSFIEDKLRKMMEQNHTRIDFAQKLQEIIEQYNAGGSSTENYFDDLMKFAEGMKSEDERHVKEGLTEDELELYDTLRKEKLTKAEEQKVKLAAKHLISRLLDEHPRVLVQDWWKDGQTQRIVKAAVEEVLDNDFPLSADESPRMLRNIDTWGSTFMAIYDQIISPQKNKP